MAWTRDEHRLYQDDENLDCVFNCKRWKIMSTGGAMAYSGSAYPHLGSMNTKVLQDIYFYANFSVFLNLEQARFSDNGVGGAVVGSAYSMLWDIQSLVFVHMRISSGPKFAAIILFQGYTPWIFSEILRIRVRIFQSGWVVPIIWKISHKKMKHNLW